MTIKRVILIILTFLAIALMSQDLFSSLNRPQFQNQLELYQTNLLLQASELPASDANLAAARNALLGEDPIKGAMEQYQEVRQTTQKNLDRARQLAASGMAAETKPLRASLPKGERSLAVIDLNLGMLQVQQGELEAAQASWARVSTQSQSDSTVAPLPDTAQVLSGLWSQPPQILPKAEQQITRSLNGWFRYRALSQLYRLQQRPDALVDLQYSEQQMAEAAFVNLALVGGLPVIGSTIGTILLLMLIAQWLLRNKQALLSLGGVDGWQTPWDGEMIWQVLIFGFFFLGQIAFPLVLGSAQSITGISIAGFGERAKAVYILVNYLFLAAGGLLVLYWSIKPYFPLPEGWFQFNWKANWLLWGVGGYFVALPLVILVSLINQQLWQGGGGSNPILPIALEGKDPVALGCFFFTAAIAAPIFEETLFRGFLLPSLTRFMSLWAAIALSSVIFAVAHLSLSEVLPLTILGMVLGFVYVRSRNLLASILLHSLWNTGTLVSLLLLGNGLK
ncbi:MAG: lysostaphin resistance A-like protein [Leptolyngbyaceae cyanobacterium]